VFAVCEPGCGENVFVWLAAGWFELIRLLVCVRFALGWRSDVLLLLGEVGGRSAAFDPFDDEARFWTGRFTARLSAGRFPAERFSAGPDARACFGDIAGAW